MFRVSALFLALTLALPGTVSAQGPDRPIRAGTYDLAITFGGGQLEATLEIGYKGDTVTADFKLGDHGSPGRAGSRSPLSAWRRPSSEFAIASVRSHSRRNA